MHDFWKRHIGPSEDEQQQMLQKVGVKNIDELIDVIIPSNIRLNPDVKKDIYSDGLPPRDQAVSEQEYLEFINIKAKKNIIFKSFIGMGYNDTIVPPVIQRNVLENPGWYTSYTPYQAEISQGRLEALLNFQTMVIDLTGLEIANASLLDEATSAAEAMIMFYNSLSRVEVGKTKFFIADDIFPQTKNVILGRAKSLGIEIVEGNHNNFSGDETFFGALVQYPNKNGVIGDIKGFTQRMTTQNIRVAVVADIMSLVLLEAPGHFGADVVCGSTQRFGVPMGFGGPHAAFFATKEKYKRNIPGRIIGVSKDADGNTALRMALQTREQHIKREKATSNICTAQALLATMAGMYAVYHGPKGLRQIAEKIHSIATITAKKITEMGFEVNQAPFFDTIWIKNVNTQNIETVAHQAKINFNILSDSELTISFGESHGDFQIEDILKIFAYVKSADNNGASSYILPEANVLYTSIPEQYLRKDKILTHPVFNSYHSETKMMRYLKKLENKDISLVHSMIPLGSCTMKLNATIELMPITNPNFANLHPFAPIYQTEGMLEIIRELEQYLCRITGFAGVSLQPNSGANGEYTGLMIIRAYHEAKGDTQRKKILIPSSAHGTNPASAVMAGLQVVVTKCDENGNVDIEDLRQKASEIKNELFGIMITYPSTHGVYEQGIVEIMDIIHQNGGQVYMDGANMNAQVGYTNPGTIGADVCHLNLHKTFAIPHGGGGPGVGPIGVAKHLVKFLPANVFNEEHKESSIAPVSAAPFGSALVLLISYGYIRLMGDKGLKQATQIAILNANYMAYSLKNHYPLLYASEAGRVAHELILDCREFKKTADVEVADIAKRLMDFGFHAPTVSFPVAGTLMIEPTESEDKEEMDRFIAAMIKIREEIREIENGYVDKTNNLLKNAPHTAECMIAKDWNYPYTPQEAAYPISYLKECKYWPPVRRVDNALGDRNLVCSCPQVESYA